jgi:hypothetical protein
MALRRAATSVMQGLQAQQCAQLPAAAAGYATSGAFGATFFPGDGIGPEIAEATKKASAVAMGRPWA